MNLSPIRELLRELRETKYLVAEIVAGRVPHDDGRLAFRLFGMDATLARYDQILPPTPSKKWETMTIEPSRLAKILEADFVPLEHINTLREELKTILDVMDLAKGVDRNACETINIAAYNAADVLHRYDSLFGELPKKIY